MRVLDLYSKRQRRARGEVPDVYVYNMFPNALKVQIVHIIRDSIGKDIYSPIHAAKLWKDIDDALCREYGVFSLVSNASNPAEEVLNYFLQEKSVEKSLDVVELCFQLINSFIRDNFDYLQETSRGVDPNNAIKELNTRFKEHGIGYQFESNKIIRIDTEFIHTEIIKPVLDLLRSPGYEGVNEEFLQAHDHYRHGNYKDSLVYSLKSFESTMKSICKKKRWVYKQEDTAKTLISICLSNGLFPRYLESYFTSLRSLLESGIPTVRNKEGGHGQGPEPIVVPEYLARFGINLTASSILLLVNACNEK